MSDPTLGGPPPGPYPPSPRPLAVAPEALPLPYVEKRRSPWPRRIIITSACVLIVGIVASCAVLLPAMSGFLGQAADYGQMSFVSGSSGAWWSADGAWVFAQSSDANGASTITAVRVSDRVTRTLKGYWLVAIEPTGSRARVVPDPGTRPFDFIGRSVDPTAVLEAADAAAISPTSFSDLPGTEAVLWDPDGANRPTKEAWAKETVPGWDVNFQVDQARGVYPTRITIWPGQGATFTIESARTMRPIGLSASRRYYAVMDLSVEPGFASEETPDRTLTLRVWDLASRSEVASATFQPGIATLVVWSPVEDALYWTQRGSETEAEPFNVVHVLRPGKASAAVPLSKAQSEEAPMVAGTDSKGVLVRLLTGDEVESAGFDGASGDPTSETPRPVLMIRRGARVSAQAKESVHAVFAEARPRGVIWWMPNTPSDDTGMIAPFASGITVWWAPSIDSTPTKLLDMGLEDATPTN